MKTNHTFSENLAALMKERGITQEELANHLGLATSSVCRWLAGSKPRPHALVQLANFFLITVKELAGSAENPKHTFSENLAALMKERCTQWSLSASLGVSQAAISKWLNGSLPNSSQLFALAQFFGISMEQLLNGSTAQIPAAVEPAKILSFPDAQEHFDAAFGFTGFELGSEKEAPHQSRGARWPGASIAARDLKVNHSHLYRVLNGERPSPPLIKRWNAWLKEHPEFAALQKKKPAKKSA